MSDMQTPPTPAALSASDERTWAMLAHLSILANLVTGIAGPVIALVIYLVYKDRSRFVGFHAMQSFLFQLIAWVGAWVLVGVSWTVSGLLAVVLIGLLLIPVTCLFTLVPFAALVYGVIGGIQAGQGQDFRYWLVAGWVESLM